MDVDQLADRIWQAIERDRATRARLVRDPAIIGLFIVFIPFVAFDILSFHNTAFVAGAFSVLLLARMGFLRRQYRREEDER